MRATVTAKRGREEDPLGSVLLLRLKLSTCSTVTGAADVNVIHSYAVSIGDTNFLKRLTMSEYNPLSTMSVCGDVLVIKTSMSSAGLKVLYHGI